MDKSCFVIMPIGNQEFGKIKLSAKELKQKYDDLISEAIRRADPSLKVIRADEITYSGSIPDQIIELLINCKYVIADITYPNPNVFYELGIRHSCKPGTIIIREKGGFKTPFDISHLRFSEYENTPTGLKKLSENLKIQFKSFDGNLQPDSPVLNKLESRCDSLNNSISQDAKTNMSGMWKNKGDVHYELGQYKEASDAYFKGIEGDPENEELWFKEGECLLKLGEDNPAIKAFDKALQINPEYVGVWYNKAVIYYNYDNCENYEKALEACKKELEVNLTDDTKRNKTWKLMGHIYDSFADHIKIELRNEKASRVEKENALNAYCKALELEPTDSKLWCSKGDVLFSLARKESNSSLTEYDPEKLEEALEAYNKVLYLEPENSEAHHRKKQVLNELSKI